MKSRAEHLLESDWVPVQSTTIARYRVDDIGDANTADLIIQFKSKENPMYVYYRVPLSMISVFANAQSKGKWLDAHLKKTKWSCDKIA